jgi:Putative beta-lactamase-inhibitor-like, PepSY-like
MPFVSSFIKQKSDSMKKLMVWLMVSTLVISGDSALAQLRKIPAAVTQAFKDKFSEAGNVEWKDKLTGFEASFVLDEVKYQTTFSTKGEWKMTETLLSEADMPEDVQEGFERSKYKEWEIKSVSLLETGDSQTFVLMVQKTALLKKRLYFSYDGQLLKDPITL